HRNTIAERIRAPPRVLEQLYHGAIFHDRCPVADRLLRAAAAAIMRNGCFRDVIVHEPGPPYFIAEVNIFCVHEIVLAHHPNLLKHMSSHQHACSRYRVSRRRAFACGEEGGKPPKRTVWPAQLQILCIERLIEYGWELLY